MQIPAVKTALDKEWNKMKKVKAWDETKVRSKDAVIGEAKAKNTTLHVASLMDFCLPKLSELEEYL